jgi:hypothetical protein
MSLRTSIYCLFIGLVAIAGTGCSSGQNPWQPATAPAITELQAKSSPLLYVSDGSSGVSVYTYPALKSAGKLTGFEQPEGLCVDKAGDVWVVDFGGEQIVEYAHGATKPKATLKTPASHNPFACTVDPQTGDLAVTAWYGGSGPGYLYVFAKAKGTPKTYSDSAFHYALYPGYDDKGNLWLDGTASGSAFVYAELAKGKSAFTQVKLKQAIAYPGNVQYDGKYVALGDLSSGKIYRTMGAKVVGTTSFSDTSSIYAYYIDGSSVICADGTQTVEIYKYPAGGAPTATLDFAHAASLAVSGK